MTRVSQDPLLVRYPSGGLGLSLDGGESFYQFRCQTHFEDWLEQIDRAFMALDEHIGTPLFPDDVTVGLF